MKLRDLITSELVWNKECIQVVMTDDDGHFKYSKVTRIEFLCWESDYENAEVIGIEPIMGRRDGYSEDEPILLITLEEVEKC